jgi:DNA polymerase III alpha subunit
MIQNKFGELVYNEIDLCDLIMQGQDILSYKSLVVDQSVNLEQILQCLQNSTQSLPWKSPQDSNTSVEQFHAVQQTQWNMPDHYKNLDIAEHVLNLCQDQAQLQRCGAELLLYQERNLFDLLRYLKYLVDIMSTNKIIWGVGRGSSVSSYVLFKLGVHRIDSMYYNLDVQEFLR